MSKLAEIKQKFGGILVDEIVKSKPAINRNWKDDKGKRVCRNIEILQNQFEKFYQETAKLFTKLEEVEQLSLKLDSDDSATTAGTSEAASLFSGGSTTSAPNKSFDYPNGNYRNPYGGSEGINNDLFGSDRSYYRGNNGIHERIDFNSNSSQTLSKYFGGNTLENWNNTDAYSRKSILEGFAHELSNSSQIGINQIVFKDMSERERGFFDPNTNSIVINSDVLLDSKKLKSGITTILHETRHGFQEKAVANPQKYGISEELARKWKNNMDNYIDGIFDFEAYYNQPIEADAREFADSMVRNIL